MIRLRTLGTLDLRDTHGHELRAMLAQPKRVALLAYLALALPRGLHRRDALLALLWPDHDVDHARNSLNQSLHMLRRHLGPDVIVASGDTVGVDRTHLWCDAVAFEEMLDAGRIAEALDLYRGDLLEAFHVASAPDFDRWLDAERARMASRFAKTLETAAEQRESAGDSTGAVTHWRRLAARDPYSSRYALRLMQALAAAGDPAAAVQHARVHETLLNEELGVPPDAQIAELVRQLQSAPATARAVREPSSPPSAVPAAARQRPAGVPDEKGHRPAPRYRTPLLMAGVALLAIGSPIIIGQREENPPIRSIAVLPLDNHSGDSAWQSFTDAMHDALITELARYPELRLISRTSVMQYRRTAVPLPDVARALNVDAVVQGSVFRDGARVRLTVQLIHAPTDRHLWAQTYRRDLRDILVLQSELAEAIAREVHVAALPAERQPRSAAGAPDSAPREVYLRELYARAKHAELSRSLTGVQTAKEYYRRAIERDSMFAPAYAGLSFAHDLMAYYNYAPGDVALDSARIQARRAVALDSALPEARTALANSLANVGSYHAADRELRRAIELGPSNAHAHFQYALFLVAMGRGEEALRAANRALELDPHGPRALLGMKRSAEYLITGEYPDLRIPVRQRRPIRAVEAGEPWAHGRDAVELAEEGRCDEARSDLTRAQQLAPGSLRMMSFAGTVYWFCGERPRARALLAEMKRRPDPEHHAISIALLHTRFGEADSAFAWLDRQRWTMINAAFLSADRLLHPLRSDARYARLLERIGLRPVQGRQN